MTTRTKRLLTAAAIWWLILWWAEQFQVPINHMGTAPTSALG